jgi:hypothetical protein
MRRMMNGRGTGRMSSLMGVFASRRKERMLSRGMIGLLGAIGALTAIVFLRELPSLRRYLRIERM